MIVTKRLPKLVILVAIIVFASTPTFAVRLVKDKMGNVMVVNDNDQGTQLMQGANPKEDSTSADIISYEDERTRLYAELTNNGAACISEGRYEEAISLLKKATVIKPNMPHAYINLADTYYHMGKYEDSIEASKTALCMAPLNAASYGNLGNAYYALGKKGEAMKNYQKAIAIYRQEADADGVKKIEKRIEQYSLK